MSSFIEELKRRKVFRVAATYAIVSWILMQIGEVTFPALNVPAWVMSALVLVLLLGFPVAIIFAWIFDKTPEGIVRTPSTDEASRGIGKESQTISKPVYIKKRNVFLLIGILLGTLITWFFPKSGSVSDDERWSVAVLPFNNFSDDRSDEYFSDGITEDIITQLSKIKQLKVISRTSVMEYKSTTKKMKEIAQELGVENILEGSVRKVGDEIRINAQLIDARTDEHLWAETYDRPARDIFAVQTDVAKNIATVLRGQITSEEEKSISKVPTQNIEAYNMYLRGKQEYYKYETEDFKKSVDFYKQAVKLDSFFALAHAEMANSYVQIFQVTGDNLYKKLAEEALSKAMSIDSNISVAYKAKAYIFGYEGRELDAVRSFLRAIEINQGFDEAIGGLGLAYNRLGDFSSALTRSQQFYEISPKNLWAHPMIAADLWALGEFESAIDYAKEGIEIFPNHRRCYAFLIDAYTDLGNKERAKFYLDELFNIHPYTNQHHYKAARTYYFEGSYNKMKEHLDEVENIGPLFQIRSFYIIKDGSKTPNDIDIELVENYLHNEYREKFYSKRASSHLAVLYGFKGDQEKAIEWLQKSIVAGERNYLRWENEPAFQKIKGEKFDQLIRIMKNYVQIERLEAGFAS